MNPSYTIDLRKFEDYDMTELEMNYANLCETLAEEIGMGNITVSEANRILKNARAPIEEIYFGEPVTLEEHLLVHKEWANGD